MRVFEKRYISGNLFRLEFEDPQAYAVAKCIDGPSKGDIGGPWSLVRATEDGWKDVTPPFDVTKLDTAGVFHEEEKPKVLRFFFNANSFTMIRVQYETPLEAGWVEVLRPDIANATITELRARVAELENLLKRAEDRAEFEYKCRVEAAVKKYEHYDNCKAELRDQLTKAWMRNDLTTADRIADLIGEKRPSEHEAADAKAEVRA